MVKKQLIIFPEELIEICSELDWCQIKSQELDFI